MKTFVHDPSSLTDSLAYGQPLWNSNQPISVKLEAETVLSWRHHANLGARELVGTC